VSSGHRFAVASVVGGVAALAVLAVTISQGHLTLLAREPFGNFFDAQARSLLHGRWDVPASELFIEGFRRDGKVYEYFGVWPALLRMPLLAVSDSLYGRLAQLSMLLGAVVALTGFSLLHWRIRQVLRPGTECGTLESMVVGAAVFCFGCGTAFVFLTSRAWTYHEAIVWGVAWSLLGFERLVAYATHASGRRLATVSVLTALAFASRASLGLGLAVALGLLLVVRLVAIARSRVERPTAAWTEVGAMTAAIVLPVALYAGVNFSRFGTPFSVPWTDQLLVTVNAHARAVLAENGGTYFGLKFAPTTLMQYLRPDAIAPGALFPWLTFPHFRTPVVGDVLFDTLDPASSLPASMPAVTLLAVVGLVALVRPPRAGTSVGGLRIALAGAAVGCIPVLAIAYVAQRYLADFLPALAIAALVGLQALLRRVRAPTTRRLAAVVLVATAVLAGFGIWANLSLTIAYQRLFNPSEPAVRASMLAFQYDLDGHVPGHPHQLVRVDVLPRAAASAGTTAVVGRCDSVYWSDGRQWLPVEGTPAGGWHRYRARIAATGRPTPILTWGGGEMLLTAERHGGTAVFTLVQPGRAPASGGGHLRRDSAFPLGVHVDRRLGHLQVQVGSDTVLDAPIGSSPVGDPMPARTPNVSLTPLPPHLLVCPAVDADARHASG